MVTATMLETEATFGHGRTSVLHFWTWSMIHVSGETIKEKLRTIVLGQQIIALSQILPITYFCTAQFCAKNGL